MTKGFVVLPLLYILRFCCIFADCMKKRFIVVCTCVYMSVIAAIGQSLPLSMPVSRRDTIVNDIKVWRVDDRYGMADTVAIDTAVTSYQDNQPINNYSIANSWNGNLGSPIESKIYFDRRFRAREDMFARAYRPYVVMPDDVTYYNTKRPFSQLVYRSALPTYREEDHLKVLLTMNANKYVNFGGMCNFIYGRGQYQNQSAQALTGGFWTTYTGKRYELVASVMFNSMKNRENGGIIDNNYILDPKEVIGVGNIQANNIPVNMNQAQSMYRNHNYFFNHRYNWGREVERKLDNDSVVKDFQPIITFTHTFRAEDSRRKYIETDSVLNNFYAHNYYSGRYSKDSTSYWSVKNTFAVTLNEKFNKIMKFGLSAFVEYDLRHYGLGYDSITVSKGLYHNLTVGACLFKKEGKYFKYNVNGEIYLVGPHIGEFEVDGDFFGFFNIAGEPVTVKAGAGFSDFSSYWQYSDGYFSNHFKWEPMKFRKSLSLDIRGRVALPKRNISLGVQFQNITNYLYLNEECMPAQHEGNIQVLAVDLAANIQAWRFHLDTKVVYQLTGNREILPLPDVALYGNLYYKDLFFKVLTFQFGVSVRYHTAYYGNAYMPALGQFYLQDDVLIGNYPEMNVYASLHLKTVRFFVQYYHFNKGLFGDKVRNYLSMPNYPINPATFQFGLSWNFWN